MTRAYKLWPLLLFFLTLPIMVTMLVYGLPMTHDGVTHLFRIARLDDYLRQGVLFPRWMPDMLLGYGYPTLNYYAAGAYYLTEAFHLSGLSLYWSFAAAQWALMFLAAVGFFLLARDILESESLIPPLVASIAYTYAPYLIINIYVRGAIAELGAQALVPWILWAFRRIWRTSNPAAYVFVAAFFLAALAWTHTISLLIIPPLLLIYLAFLALNATQRKYRILLTVAALTLAMLVSAFYWLPLIAERSFITDYGFVIATTMMLPKGFFTWDNLLNYGLQYRYPQDPPFRFGLVQLAGIVIGIPIALRKGGEWWFWTSLLAIIALLMSSLAKPLWFGNHILPIIQFPWRLLAIAQFPIALLFGLLFATITNRRLRTGVGLAMVALLIWVHYPRLQWEYILSPYSSKFDIAVNSYFESGRGRIIEGDYGTASIQEFRPKWTTQTLTFDPATLDQSPLTQTVAPAMQQGDIELVEANDFGLSLRTHAQSTFLLRTASYYFPGWRATLDGSVELSPIPTTNLGLLSVDIPAGEHSVTIYWSGTGISYWAALISQVGLLLLGLYQLAQPSPKRWWGLAVIPLLAAGLAGSHLHPAMEPVKAPPTSLGIPGIALLGLRGPDLTQDGIMVHPYWYATDVVPPSVQIHWQLRAPDGTVVQEMVSNPHHDSYPSDKWPGLILMDDAHLIPLPSDLPAGRYEVVMGLLDPNLGPDLGTKTPAEVIGSVTIDQEYHATAPAHPLEVYFGDDIVLHGYDARVVEAWAEESGQSGVGLVVRAGDTLDYTLNWGITAQTNEPYVGFMHLTDQLGRAIAKSDHSPGPLFSPVAVWTEFGNYPDRYLLPIPPDAESGLYWPHVGMYNWKNMSRFDVRVPDSDTVGDHFPLPVVKVVNRSIRPQGTQINAKLGDLAELAAYEFDGGDKKQAGSVSVRPGDVITLTEYYRVKQPSATALTRFIQIRDAADAIGAQADAEPQDGLNPTWAWTPDEVVRDPVVISIPEDAKPGTYRAYLGFYDANANFQRLPMTDEHGQSLADDEILLTEIVIAEP